MVEPYGRGVGVLEGTALVGSREIGDWMMGRGGPGRPNNGESISSQDLTNHSLCRGFLLPVSVSSWQKKQLCFLG